MGGMKYFKPILMCHETFLKIFDAPQNIFLCSPLLNGSEHKISNWLSKRSKKSKTCHKSHPLSRHTINDGKNKFDAF